MQPNLKVVLLCCLTVLGVHSQTEEEQLQERLHKIARIVMYHEEFMEERIRGDGDSGIKQIRIENSGRKTYQSESVVDESVARIVDFPHTKDKIGMAEFSAVLNGVEFRAMNNDYHLRRPSTTDSSYQATENIPFPDVPPEVTSKATVDEQIAELKLWFKAFYEEDLSTRDYRPYFKPVVCYLEGAWVYANSTLEDAMPNADEMDSTSFEELQQQNKFASNAGRKKSNVPYLPTKVVNVTETGVPVLGQWTYRTLCHPIDDTVYVSFIRPIDDLATRMKLDLTFEEYEQSPAARFQINPQNRTANRWPGGRISHEYMDDIMEQVPGMDNYQGHLTDSSFNMPVYSVDKSKTDMMDTSRYHRHFRALLEDAMGQAVRRRAFNDASVFFAMTSQPEVVAMTLNDCDKDDGTNCFTLTQRWTYAFPLEFIFLTPLTKFNPYNLVFRDESNADQVTAGGRNGGNSTTTAFDGISSDVFYQTPASFFSGPEVEPVTTGTLTGDVGVKGPTQEVKMVRASGIRTFLPTIDGIDGKIRLRYPIMPYHEEGSNNMKEISAFQDMVMKPIKYTDIYSGEWLPSVQ